MKSFLSLAAAFVLCATFANAQETDQRDTDKPRQTSLAELRTYELTIDELKPTAFVGLEKRWVFTDHAFPPELLTSLKKSKLLRETDRRQLGRADRAAGVESRYARWTPDEGARDRAGAMLRYDLGEQRAELVVRVHLELDHSLGEKMPARKLTFDDLGVEVDLGKSSIVAARWDGIDLPADGGPDAAVEVTDRLLVNIGGTFDEQTRAALQGLKRLMPDERSWLLRGLWQQKFTNESHHGIRQLWADLERVEHGLFILENNRNDGGDFWYTISGEAWPLDHARQQLEDEAWPLVLSGREYVGQTDDGVQVFRPVRFVLSRPGGETTEERGNEP